MTISQYGAGYQDGFNDGYRRAMDEVRSMEREAVEGGFRYGSSDVAGRLSMLETPIKKPRKRKLSAWNKFVKVEMPKMKKKFPRSKPQQLMKKVASKWKKSTKNPNRKRRRR